MIRKKVLAGLLSAVMVASFITGCGSANNEERTFNGAGRQSEDSDTSSELDKSSDSGKGKNSAKESNNEAYEAFMNGKTKIKYEKFTNIAWADDLPSYLREGQEYNLDELVYALENNYEPTRKITGDPQQKYIDCGSDGQDELLITMDFDDTSKVAIIIKEIGGELKFCYASGVWGQGNLEIGDNGTICITTTAPGAENDYIKAFVNAEGQYKLYCDKSKEDRLFDLYADNEEGHYVKIDFSDLDTDNLMVTSYTFMDDDGESTTYYTYDIVDDSGKIITKDSDYADSNEYMQRFNDAKVKAYNKSEIETILRKRAQEIGYPEE